MPIGPKWTNLKFFYIKYCTKSKLKGVSLMKKSQLLYFGPHILGRLGHIRGSGNWPRMDELKIFNYFIHIMRIKRGSVLWKNCRLLYFGPFGQMRVSGNRPKWDQFEIFVTYSCTKSKFREGFFYEKNAISCT